MRRLVALIDGLNEAVGRAVSWLSLAMVLVTAAVVLLRYRYQMGSIALQETVLWLHGLLFLLGAGYTLKADRHVRVDVFYSRFSPRAKAGVNIVGSLLLLLPLCGWLLWLSGDYAATSWRMSESSGDAGGLSAVYLLKSIVPLAFALLALQGLAELLRNVLRLRGELPWPATGEQGPGEQGLAQPAAQPSAAPPEQP